MKFHPLEWFSTLERNKVVFLSHPGCCFSGFRILNFVKLLKAEFLKYFYVSEFFFSVYHDY